MAKTIGQCPVIANYSDMVEQYNSHGVHPPGEIGLHFIAVIIIRVITYSSAYIHLTI